MYIPPEACLGVVLFCNVVIKRVFLLLLSVLVEIFLCVHSLSVLRIGLMCSVDPMLLNDMT